MKKILETGAHTNGGLDYLQTPQEVVNQTGSTPDKDLNQGSGTQIQEDKFKPRELVLSDSRKAVIEKGLGKHAIEAMQIANGNQKKYLPALIAQLVTIDGQPVVMEDLEYLPLADYMALQAEFADQNF